MTFPNLLNCGILFLGVSQGTDVLCGLFGEVVTFVFTRVCAGGHSALRLGALMDSSVSVSISEKIQIS